MSRLLRKLAQISAGDTAPSVVRAKRGIRVLVKFAHAFGQGGEDGDFGRYVTKETNTMERDYSQQRERDLQSGLDMAWDNSALDTFSSTPPTSGKSNILERVPQETKYAARLKQALQSGRSLDQTGNYPNQAIGFAELTDAQESREIGEAHDAVEFYAPQSPEGGSVGEIFQRDGKEKAGSDMAPDLTFVEDAEARGLPQWPRVLNDSRQAGQGDEPTGQAWSRHDSFSVTNMPSVDSQGNPGPST